MPSASQNAAGAWSHNADAATGHSGVARPPTSPAPTPSMVEPDARNIARAKKPMAPATATEAAMVPILGDGIGTRSGGACGLFDPVRDDMVRSRPATR